VAGSKYVYLVYLVYLVFLVYKLTSPTGRPMQ